MPHPAVVSHGQVDGIVLVGAVLEGEVDGVGLGLALFGCDGVLVTHLVFGVPGETQVLGAQRVGVVGMSAFLPPKRDGGAGS